MVYSISTLTAALYICSSLNGDKSTSCQELAGAFTTVHIKEEHFPPALYSFFFFNVFVYCRGKVSVWAATWWNRGGAEGGVHLSRIVLLLLLAAAPTRVQRVGRWRGHLWGRGVQEHTRMSQLSKSSKSHPAAGDCSTVWSFGCSGLFSLKYVSLKRPIFAILSAFINFGSWMFAFVWQLSPREEWTCRRKGQSGWCSAGLAREGKKGREGESSDTSQ